MEKEKAYTIIGHQVEGPLEYRLNEAKITAIDDFPGVVVYTKQGVYYSELYDGQGVELAPVPRKKLTETTQGLVESTTKEMAARGNAFFSVVLTLSAQIESFYEKISG